MITKIKGTQDVLPADVKKWQELEYIMRQVSKIYNFTEIRTPIFEASELFHRGVGETSDIVKKETYDFTDRGDRQITLRAEGTAPIVRSVLENKLYASSNLPLKLFYYGPMFRYERPQKGRQRQFHQFGAEAIGLESPYVDSEMIAYATTFLRALRIPGVLVKINTLGDQESKETYKQVLRDYLRPQVSGLCPDCQRRYEDNPLRVLDCKLDQDNQILVEAPKPYDYLSATAKAHFDSVIANLDAMDIPYVIDKKLVRGLDYYTHTVFELESNLETLGAQSTLCGGGRYNNLSEALGGPNLPAVGFAFGLERLLLAMEAIHTHEQPDFVHAYMIALGDKAKTESLAIVETLRHGGLVIDYDFLDRSLKAQFKQAEKANPRFYLIYGEDEIASASINVKDARSGEQENVPLDNLYEHLVMKIREASSGCSGSCDSCEEECE